MKWLDKISLLTLVIIAVPLALAPFYPEPHLVEKIRLLIAGQLVKVIDIADLAMHGVPMILLIVKVTRIFQLKGK